MYAVTVHFSVKDGQMEQFLSLMLENAKASVTTEPGCLQFDVWTDPEQPNTVFLYETYTDRAAFETHMTMPHFHTVNAATEDLVADKQVICFANKAS